MVSIQDSVHLESCPFGIVSILDRVHSGFGTIWDHGHLGSCPFGIVSNWDHVDSRWCPFEIVSIWDGVFLDRVHLAIVRITLGTSWRKGT